MVVRTPGNSNLQPLSRTTDRGEELAMWNQTDLGSNLALLPNNSMTLRTEVLIFLRLSFFIYKMGPLITLSSLGL